MTTAIKLKVKLWHDHMPTPPDEIDGWKPYSFNRRHGNFKDPDDLDTPEIEAKLKVGLAFKLSYYEHGPCRWSLAGQGPSCRFDSVRRAGILVWEQDESDLGPKSYEEREKDAKAFIDRFTEWCNGNVFGYSVYAFKSCCTCGQNVELTDEEADTDLGSCGGYYEADIKGMVADIKHSLGSDLDRYEVEFENEPGVCLADEAMNYWKEGA